eukprot:TRINITY_DN38158_c0_g1_i1.p1 TRINITY_DN38158_c0_g1~~TRINITY_DN38158_c0_g1_i1.p1  ORF type:complete len:407 (+),score=95.90 TRINITY_DN38158_c0_g1_i1:46-1266(+)
MAGEARCCCGVQASALSDGRKMLRCGKCKAVFYCSPECQKADWRRHKLSCGAPSASSAAAAPAATAAAASSSSSRASPAADTRRSTDPAFDVDVVKWGGPLVQGESLSERLKRVSATALTGKCYADRVAKARELFRLGFLLCADGCCSEAAQALCEGFLVEENSLPGALARAQLSAGPESVPFGQVVGKLRSRAPSRSASEEAVALELRLAFLQVRWLDMQMLLTRELCDRAQDDPDAATAHQQRWFDLLLEMDDLARKTLARSLSQASADPRLLARLTLVQAQYGANPPLDRPQEECDRLAAQAVKLWPEDVQGLLERDAPQHALLLQRLQVLKKQSQAEPRTHAGTTNDDVSAMVSAVAAMNIPEEADSDEFKISGGDFIVVDGDHTEKTYEEVMQMLGKETST